MSDETSTATGGATATADTTAQATATQTQANTQTAAADATATKPVVPEKYDLKAPEGYTFNADALAKFQEQARARGLTQEQAQADINYLIGEITGMEQRQADAWKATQEKWVSDIKADKELGGSNFEQTMARSKAFAKVLDPTGEFSKVIDAMGIGNHPVLVRGFAKLGRLLEDDTVDVGSSPASPNFDPSILYPSMRKTG